MTAGTKHSFFQKIKKIKKKDFNMDFCQKNSIFPEMGGAINILT